MSTRQRRDSIPRRRTTRACDQCRKTKSRCEHPAQTDEPCRNCLLAGLECTFHEPMHKRGPPKGYLSALEQRLHDAEALLGVIISSNDLRATTLVSDLSKDPLAGAIIARVTNSAFGPVGRNLLRHSPSRPLHRSRATDSPQQSEEVNGQALMLDGNGHLVFTTPSNTWQDYLNLRLSLVSRSWCQESQKPFTQDASSLSLPALNGKFDISPTSGSNSLKEVPAGGAPVASAVDFGHCGAASELKFHKTATVHANNSDGSDSDSASLSSRSSESTRAADLGSVGEVVMDPFVTAYDNLANSLGLDGDPEIFLAPLRGSSHPPLDSSDSPVAGLSLRENSGDGPWVKLVPERCDLSPPIPQAYINDQFGLKTV